MLKQSINNLYRSELEKIIKDDECETVERVITHELWKIYD